MKPLSGLHAFFTLMENIDVPELIARLGSEEDSVRKPAVFKLKINIGDPSFADSFIQHGGLTELHALCLHATGNTLAYSLASLSRLLELDVGWQCVSPDLIQRVSSASLVAPMTAG